MAVQPHHRTVELLAQRGSDAYLCRVAKSEKRIPVRLRLIPPIKGEKKNITVEIKQRHLTEDIGSFTFGLCTSCDWRGPGRRSREKARDDVKAHHEDCPGKGKTVLAEGEVRS